MLNLVGESSIGSGVRRVEALVADDAFRQFAAERALVSTLSSNLKVAPDQLVDRVSRLVSQLKDAEKQIAALRAQSLRSNVASMVEKAETIGGVRYLGLTLPGVAGSDLRPLATDLRERLGSGPAVVAIVGGSDDKAAAVVATNQGARDLGLRAGALIALASATLGGKGGGRDDMAQGGGTNPRAADAALQAVRSAIGDRG